MVQAQVFKFVLCGEKMQLLINMVLQETGMVMVQQILLVTCLYSI